MNWKELYASKLKTIEEAVKIIKSGDRVVISHAVGEPVKLVDAMVDYVVKMDLRDIEINQQIDMGHSLYARPGMEKHFRQNSFFVGTNTRDCVNSGRGDFTPCFFYQIPDLFRSFLKPDVLLATFSLPDEHGYCSFGVACDYTKPAAEIEGVKVIGVLNPTMPRTHGDCFIHIRDIDAIVEDNTPVTELLIPESGDVELAIGEHIASLIKDGDCLQLGIGGIPDAVLKFLGGKKNLGIHSEMLSDGIVDLYEKGVVNCSAKNFNPDKMVVSFLMGTRRLYDFADNNPCIYMAPVDYVNNPGIIGRNDNMVSINSSLQVNLMGEACSEAMGLKQFSGIGGQVDFIRGAAFSKGGRSILAFSSTAKKGTISRIVPYLTYGATVTTCRNDVDYVVTEYGIARMKGHTLRDRARQLIRIAAPQFREELAVEFEKRFAEKYLEV
ncbi:acetyl-CoA hydrolase/transferase family protein [Lacrimispora celerecrescens]|uniref:4-hydroxybutyrate CoA-transferase n=1 Tax=[Clostridium] celerecrescens 18A TaxID=1286362 RepID=A0A2M8Z0A6_9FIRM|nr:acetyl-CoA hydrolase/transferase C-terminal domain-containing protein [Lacrimispora celerecrescens]PJJ26876.1 4-hydroxybutyrate CoA-transferase [[Clostridium] celerecrescens 18A]